MNILVTGANGQLGRELRTIASSSADDGHSWIFTDVVTAPDVDTLPLDILDADSTERIVHDYDVNIIVNCAAYTDVAGAESNENRAYELNAIAPRILAEVMKSVGGWLIHISTDYVFGGAQLNTPCHEATIGTPTGAYGRTKLAGELAIISTAVQHIIIRTAWLYSPWGKNFVKTMLELTRTRPNLDVVYDQVGTPTCARGLAETIGYILSQPLQNEHIGIYHYTDEGVTSWYDFAVAIAQLAGHNTCHIHPCRSSDYPSPVKRPAYSVLDKTKIKKTFGIDITHWTARLKETIDFILQSS